MSTNTSASEAKIEQQDWSAEVADLRRRRALSEAMGGPTAVEYQHGLGKMTARERIARLCDEESFREFGSLTGKAKYDDDGELAEFTPANSVVGSGQVNGRHICVAADDFTIRGGSSEAANPDKWIYLERLALETANPLIRLVDTAGGSVKLLDQNQTTRFPDYSKWPVFPLLESVPVVGVALGSCAGLGALKVLASHFSIMVRDTSQVFAAGPPVVKQALGIDIDKNELGGYKVHARHSGLVDNEAIDEADALEQVRKFLSYLPQNVWSLPKRVPCDDPVDREEEFLDTVIPRNRRKVYDPRKIVAAICDCDSLFEIGRYYGRSVITQLARLNGVPVGIMIGDPREAGGAMTLSSATKIERFVELCDRFHLPVINFVDQPGNMTGPEAERAGTLRGALRVMKVIEKAKVPWVSIVVRRAFGLAGGLHGAQYGMDGHRRPLNHRFGWPSARWGSIPIEGGVAAAYKRDIAAAPDPVARRQELEEHYNRLSSPLRTAERFLIVDIIEPRKTRKLLCDWIDLCQERMRINVEGQGRIT
ncbi:acyl-CoA carboxylase subunit beta [Aquamicrobium zhengzhouense]|uniref:Propionyl-CoA carboxylase n=1 Tax=Aquamicrobium zhengzhouense TaxID=2781738 RepID=A0ABS0SEE7_9HYPH|nr:carboxyl transferase domain-containing protein [Aquamicrobium zhengzhouense]MBI1621665.1 propionyl-CoA carboxylase [Aquamicrobium zhengzhouense]